jgi:hypothetical protein
MSGMLNELARFISAPGADALKALFNSKGFISVPLGAVTTEPGVALTTQATTVTGFTQLANKETVINIPINTNPAAGKNLGFVVPTPIDLDLAYPVEVHVLVGKAANLDELTLDCEVFPVAAGDVANADIQLTAATAITEAASELVFTCNRTGMLAAPGGLSVVLILGGTNDGDAVYVYSVWLEYTKLLLNE